MFEAVGTASCIGTPSKSGRCCGLKSALRRLRSRMNGGGIKMHSLRAYYRLKSCLPICAHYDVRMKTMTATQARRSLGTILTRVLQGEDIGIVHSGSCKIVALRPVEVYSEDYALTEYGITPKEMERAEKRILSDIKKERKAGKLKPWRP